MLRFRKSFYALELDDSNEKPEADSLSSIRENGENLKFEKNGEKEKKKKTLGRGTSVLWKIFKDRLSSQNDAFSKDSPSSSDQRDLKKKSLNTRRYMEFSILVYALIDPINTYIDPTPGEDVDPEVYSKKKSVNAGEEDADNLDSPTKKMSQEVASQISPLLKRKILKTLSLREARMISQSSSKEIIIFVTYTTPEEVPRIVTEKAVEISTERVPQIPAISVSPTTPDDSTPIGALFKGLQPPSANEGWLHSCWRAI